MPAMAAKESRPKGYRRHLVDETGIRSSAAAPNCMHDAVPFGQLPCGAVHELALCTHGSWVIEPLDRPVMVEPIGRLSAALKVRDNEFKDPSISDN